MDESSEKSRLKITIKPPAERSKLVVRQDPHIEQFRRLQSSLVLKYIEGKNMDLKVFTEIEDPRLLTELPKGRIVLGYVRPSIRVGENEVYIAKDKLPVLFVHGYRDESGRHVAGNGVETRKIVEEVDNWLGSQDLPKVAMFVSCDQQLQTGEINRWDQSAELLGFAGVENNITVNSKDGFELRLDRMQGVKLDRNNPVFVEHFQMARER